MSIPAPVTDLYTVSVKPEWIDHNDHMNVAYYTLAFDLLIDEWHEYLGLGPAYRKQAGVTTMAAECHIIYARELRVGDPLTFTSMLLDHDEKRIHYYHEMFHGTEGYLAATYEQVTLHMNTEQRRVAPMAPALFDRLAAIKKSHDTLPRPKAVGRVMGVKAGRPL
ncbi:MAG: thioesterase family protein [Acetobacterales bacterium]